MPSGAPGVISGRVVIGMNSSFTGWFSQTDGAPSNESPRFAVESWIVEELAQIVRRVDIKGGAGNMNHAHLKAAVPRALNVAAETPFTVFNSDARRRAQ